MQPQIPELPFQITDGSTGVDDMFAGLEEWFKSQADDSSAVKTVDTPVTNLKPADVPKDISEVLKDNKKPEEGQQQQQPQKEQFKPLSVKVGDQEYQIKSQDQLAKLVERSVMAGELYQEYQKLQKEYQELTEDFEKLEELYKDPYELLEFITEEMDEEILQQWMRDKIEYWKLDEEGREKYKAYIAGQKAIEREKRMAEKLAKLEAKEAEARAAEEQRQLRAFYDGLVKQYQDILEPEWITQVVNQQIELAKSMQAQGKDVSLAQFQKMVRDIVEPVAKRLKPQANPTGRLQSSAPAGAVTGQPAGQKDLKQVLSYDPLQGFDLLLSQLNQ